MGERHPSPGEAIAEMGQPPSATSLDDRWQTRSIAGTPDRVRELIETMVADVAADEVMIQDMILDQTARRRSYELLADAFGLSQVETTG
jgi:alkanesulfonate monooxygenase SsuD/methylene tetrahydromethanopterin reductase-like flavin-dependent oxidoreductase (luciferase family)